MTLPRTFVAAILFASLILPACRRHPHRDEPFRRTKVDDGQKAPSVKSPGDSVAL